MINNNIHCKICKQDVDITKQNLFSRNHLKPVHNITSKQYYDMFYKKENEGVCPNCFKETKFIKQSKGYTKYCNYECKKEFIKKRKIANDKNYGLTRNEKVKKTLLERYGSENYVNTDK